MLPGSVYFLATPFTTLCQILSYLALVGLLILLAWTVKKWIALASIELKAAWLFIVACYVFIVYLHYPGYVGYDDLNTATVLITGKAYGWQSLAYSVFLAVSLLLGGGYGVPVVVFVLAFVVLLLRLFIHLDQMGLSRRWLIFLAGLSVLLALHPFNQCFLLFHSRDILFSLALCHIGFFLVEKTKWTTAAVILFSLALIILSDLRQEAKIYLVLVPCAFFLNNQWQWRHLKIYIPSILIFGFLYFGALISYFEIQSYSRDYQVTALVLPLSQIFHDLKSEEIPIEDTANINAVLDVKKLKDHFNPLDIDPFHQGAFNHKNTTEEWSRFLLSARRLIVKHFPLVLQNRIFLARNALNIFPRPLIYDDLRNSTGPFGEFREKLNIPASRFHEAPWAKMHSRWIRQAPGQGLWFDSIFFSLLIPLLVLLASLCFFSHLSIVLFSALILVRLPVLFLTAPAAYVKYIYSLQISATLTLILLLSLWARKSSKTAEGSTPA